MIGFGLKVLSTSFGFFNPFELNFAITYKCNSRCNTCNIWKFGNRNARKELSLRQIERFAKNSNFINWIRLTGGEPFLRKDYTDIVRVLDKYMNLHLISTPTNGLMPELVYKNVEAVLKFFKGRYVITVSLDGPKDVHDRIRIKGSWDRAIETYKHLALLQKAYKRFRVFFGYTISPYNAGRFFDTVDEVNNELIVNANDFHINLFQTSDVYYHNKKSRLTKEYVKKTRKEVYQILKARKHTGIVDSIEKRYLELVGKYLKTNKTPIDCNIFNLSAFLDPYGNVYPCSMFNRKLGNIKEDDLKDILTSDSAKAVRKEIEKKQCPHCWTPCEAHQMIMSNWWKL